MSALLFRVETIERTGLGIRLTPGLTFSQAASDSRFFGVVPVSSLEGKPLYVYWSSVDGRMGLRSE